MKALFRSLQVSALVAVLPATVGFFAWQLSQTTDAEYVHFPLALFGAPLVFVACVAAAVWAGDRA